MPPRNTMCTLLLSCVAVLLAIACQPTLAGANGAVAGSMRSCIVVPAYNEEERLPLDAFVSFARAHPDIHFLFVSDGSTDDTAGMLVRLASSMPDGSAAVLNLKRNVGKAEATRVGMLECMQGRTPAPHVVGFWDADLATPLEEIPTFLNLLQMQQELHMVFGARVRLLGRKIERFPMRHYLGRVFATLTSLTLDLSIYDSQCGAKLFRVSPQLTQVLASQFANKWIFDVELLARYLVLFRRDGIVPEEVIVEQPLREWRDINGSKLKLGDKVSALRGLAHIWQTYMSPWSSWPASSSQQGDNKSSAAFEHNDL